MLSTKQSINKEEKELQLNKIYTGKARDVYQFGNDKFIMVASDRISMHVPLPFEIEHKGDVLNKTSEFWFNKFNNIIKNHMITTDTNAMPECFQKDYYKNRCMLVKKLKMIPIECIVRGYITGSGWCSYKERQSVCGIKLKSGLQEFEKLDKPIFTPTTKMQNGQDADISFKQFEEVAGKSFAKKIRQISIKLYREAAKYALSKGIIIADTKFEFGIDENNNLVLGDEILTPDSSRFWLAKDYKLGKKQTNFDRYELWVYVKNHPVTEENKHDIPKSIIDKISQKYLMIYYILTGQHIN